MDLNALPPAQPTPTETIPVRVETEKHQETQEKTVSVLTNEDQLDSSFAPIYPM